MNAFVPLATRLPAVDGVRAQLQTRLIGALNNRIIDGMHTTARAASIRDRRAASTWLHFRVQDLTVAIAPLLVDGALAHIAGAGGQPDAAAAAAVLGQIEPLVAALELIVGHELHPIGVEGSVEGDPVLVRLDAATEHDALRNRVLIALPPELDTAAIAEPDFAAPMIGRLRLRWTAAIAGPDVLVSRLGTLSAGDLLLLGVRPLVARLTLPGRRDTLGARLDPQAGVLTVDDDTSIEPPHAAGPEMTAPWADVRVATVIEIAGGSLSAAELATLGSGSVLPIPHGGGALAVKLRAGETMVADGELVAIGDGFGVLITAVAAPEA